MQMTIGVDAFSLSPRGQYDEAATPPADCAVVYRLTVRYTVKEKKNQTKRVKRRFSVNGKKGKKKADFTPVSSQLRTASTAVE